MEIQPNQPQEIINLGESEMPYTWKFSTCFFDPVFDCSDIESFFSPKTTSTSSVSTMEPQPSANVENEDRTQLAPILMNAVSSNPDFQFVFKESPPGKSQMKNTNLTKFLIKTFKNNYEEGEDSQFKAQLKQAYILIQENGLRKIKINMLERLFGASENLKNSQRFFRKKMAQILSGRTFVNNDIMFSSFIKGVKHKKHYLLASKIYRLRCKSASLTGRTQTK